jgi:hypothetical protein
MSAPDGPAPRVRASDAERDRVAEVVRRAVGDGRLTIVEGDERLAAVYAAVHRDELTEATHDLEPEPVVVTGLGAHGSAAPIPPATGREPSTSSFSLMHGTTRRGVWAPGPEHSAAAIMGGVELDLRHARLDPQDTTIRAVAIMGGIVITVGPDVEVRCEGVGLMGGFADQTGPPVTPPLPGAPSLKIVGLAMWGGVEIRRRERDELPAE